MKSRALDQFYTKPEIAKGCFNTTLNYLWDNCIDVSKWLEPSAGTGAFFSLLPDNKLGFDLEPLYPGVIKDNFLDVNLDYDRFITIGNPPFGKNSSLALSFLNKAGEHSQVVAFILPKTFKKVSIVNRVNPYLHLAYEEDLPKNSFIFNGSNYNVPCVFQIWVTKDVIRPKIETIKSHPDIIFSDKLNSTIAIQRVGNMAGKVKLDFQKYSPSSHYFLKVNDPVINILRKIDWSSIKYNTSGNPSISKHELIEAYINELNRGKTNE